MITAEQIAAAITAFTYPYTSEDLLQAAIARALNEKQIEHAREVRLDPRNRIDFLVGTIGIEIKVDGSTMAVTRQLQRYAQFEAITELILVTTRSRMLNVARELTGKRVNVLFLGRDL